MKWTFLFALIPFWGIAQEEAFFETTIYFEDAVGNVDSVIVGHDESANGSYNPNFGEVDIAEPWDSVFEVRAAHFFDWWLSIDGESLLSKKIIGLSAGGIHPTYGCLMNNEPIVVFANVENMPLSVSWDQSAFSGSYCRNRTTITSNVTPIIADYWYIYYEEGVDFSCMAESGGILFDTFDIYDGFGFYLVDEMENGSVDTMVAMLLVFRDQTASDSPCTATVGINHVGNGEGSIEIYPNPSHDWFYIDSGAFDHWKIFDQKLKVVKTGRAQLVHTGELQSGVYFLSFFDRDNVLIQTEKFVKMD